MKTADLVAEAVYAYRRAPKNTSSPFERVRYLGDPPAAGRVGVAFESGERAGQEGEVTLGQLVAPWEDVEKIVAEEQGLEELERVEPPQLADQALAVEMMLWMSGGSNEIGAVRGGIVLPEESVCRFAAELEMDEAELRAAPSFLTRAGDVVLPLNTAHAVAKALAARHPVKTLEWIEEWEASDQRNPPTWLQAFAQIRRWTGVTRDDLDRARDNADAQKELRRTLLGVRESLDAIEKQVDQLRGRIDKALKADDEA